MNDTLGDIYDLIVAAADNMYSPFESFITPLAGHYNTTNAALVSSQIVGAVTPYVNTWQEIQTILPLPLVSVVLAFMGTITMLIVLRIVKYLAAIFPFA